MHSISLNMLETETSTPKSTKAPARAAAPPSATTQAPIVFDYKDYRVFLSDWFRFRKTLQPQYSGALFAKKAGLNSHTILGMVMRGERNLSASSIRAFCRA